MKAIAGRFFRGYKRGRSSCVNSWSVGENQRTQVALVPLTEELYKQGGFQTLTVLTLPPSCKFLVISPGYCCRSSERSQCLVESARLGRTSWKRVERGKASWRHACPFSGLDDGNSMRFWRRVSPSFKTRWSPLVRGFKKSFAIKAGPRQKTLIQQLMSRLKVSGSDQQMDPSPC